MSTKMTTCGHTPQPQEEFSEETKEGFRELGFALLAIHTRLKKEGYIISKRCIISPYHKRKRRTKAQMEEVRKQNLKKKTE